MIKLVRKSQALRGQQQSEQERKPQLQLVVPAIGHAASLSQFSGREKIPVGAPRESPGIKCDTSRSWIPI
jgi:hypothetical protein